MQYDDPNAPRLDTLSQEDTEGVQAEGTNPTSPTADSETKVAPGSPPQRPSQRVAAFLQRAAANTREQSAKATRQVAEHGAPIVQNAAKRVVTFGSQARDSVRTRLAPIDDIEAFERNATPLIDPNAIEAPLPVTAVTGVALAAASVGAFANTTDLMRFT